MAVMADEPLAVVAFNPGFLPPSAEIAAPAPAVAAVCWAWSAKRSWWAVVKTPPWPLTLSLRTPDPLPNWVIQNAPPDEVVSSLVASVPP
jgi:hypothetical protein